MTDPDHIPHGSPEMLCHEIACTTAAAAFHADMAAQYAAARNIAGMTFALRSLIACTKAAAAHGRDLLERQSAEERRCA